MTNLSSLLGPGLSVAGGQIVSSRKQVVQSIGTTSMQLAWGTDYIFTLIGNPTFTFPALPTGSQQIITLTLIQDTTGGRTVTLPTGPKYPGGTAPSFTTTANAVGFVSYRNVGDGVTVLGSNQ